MGRIRTGAVLSLAAASCWAHPVNFECNDPRFDPGNQAMHVYATPNHADSALSFTVDTTTYRHGSQVHVTVEAKGSKYVDQPYGVYLAIRALPRLGYVGDYGQFSNLTHLNLSKGDCPNQVFTPDAFTGKATATWTAGEGTYEDVTLSLLWGNGPGPDDPLAGKFPNISHAFLYLRTIKLQGPGIPSDPPLVKEGRFAIPDGLFEAARLGSRSLCVAPGDGSYNLPHSPVFIQKLRTFPAKDITLPAGQCLPCREDHRQQCASARVDCPDEPGALATEHLYSSADCSGAPLDVRKLPAAFVHCPGHGRHSPDLLDLERFVHKLTRDHAAHFQDEMTARAAISEYRKLLQLIQKFPDLPIVPSKLVDLVWHEHILDTQTYKLDCQRLFGRYIHHAPAFGDELDDAVKAEKEAMLADQASMFKQYVAFFEDEPPQDVWPTARRLAAGHLPDCCRALCVKPDCASCVGCNAVDCGKMDESSVKASREREALPESFLGYVPAPRNLLQQLPSCPMTYLCHAQPMAGMNLSWTIAHDYIYMRQTLEGRETWYAVGFSDVEPFDMGLADYIVTQFNKNYSGIRDLYKYDKGNNYPCWDVLSQCSANGTAGTLDLMDRHQVRQDGAAMSAWTRKLVTGDYKDSPITDAKKKVLFAYGVTDYFTFHGKSQATTCDINFFSGDVTCPGTKQAEFI